MLVFTCSPFEKLSYYTVVFLLPTYKVKISEGVSGIVGNPLNMPLIHRYSMVAGARDPLVSCFTAFSLFKIPNNCHYNVFVSCTCEQVWKP